MVKVINLSAFGIIFKKENEALNGEISLAEMDQWNFMCLPTVYITLYKSYLTSCSLHPPTEMAEGMNLLCIKA